MNAIKRVALGTWGLGGQWGTISASESLAIINTALDAGVEWIDTADCYGFPDGRCEELIGRVLKDRENPVRIVTKVGNWGKKDRLDIPTENPSVISMLVYASLGRLGVQKIDTVLCHEGNIKNPEPYIDAFERLIDSGRLENYGISTASIDIAEHFVKSSPQPVLTIEFPFSVIEQEIYQHFQQSPLRHRMKLVARSILAMGILTGKYNKDHVFEDSVRSPWNIGQKKRSDFLRRLNRMQNLIVPSGSTLLEHSLSFARSKEDISLFALGATTVDQFLQCLQIFERQDAL